MDIVLSFLEELALNNTRDWFQANKGWYDEAKLEMEKLVNTLIPGIAGFDSSMQFVAAKDCMFRIFRDVRFSKDKAPYKTNFGAWMTGAGRKSSGPGYYVHIQPGESFLAAGVYMPEPDKLKKIRQEVYYNFSEFNAILHAKEFRNHFKGVDDMDRLKKPPKDFPSDFEGIDILKNKHFTVSYPLSDQQIGENDFPKKAVRIYQTVYPFNVFLGKALDG